MLGRDYPDETCSISRALEIVGERWTMLILRDALLGLSAFEEFRESLGIATNVLTARLKLLCAEGLLVRVHDGEASQRGRYLLTEKGREMGPVLFALMKWGDRHYPTPHGAPRLTLHAGCGGEVELSLHCLACGERVTPEGLDLPLAPAFARQPAPSSG
jgi:DNA-binding HxlR family transcriptional regulator